MYQYFFVIGLAISLVGCGLTPQRSVGSLEKPNSTGLSHKFVYITTSNGKAVKNTHEAPSLYSLFIAKRKEIDGTATDSEITDFIDAGIELSNESCSLFFADHNSKHEEGERAISLINIFGDAVITAMGFEEVSQNAMSYVSLALGGTNSAYQVFKEDAYLSPTIWKLNDEVKSARKVLAKGLRTEANSLSNFQALGAMREYHDTCSRLSIISYIERSVDLTRITATTGELSANEQVTLGNLKTDMFKLIFPAREGTFTDSTISDLYVVFNTPNSVHGNILQDKAFVNLVHTTHSSLANAGDKASFLLKLQKAGVILSVDDRIAKLTEVEVEIADKQAAIPNAADGVLRKLQADLQALQGSRSQLLEGSSVATSGRSLHVVIPQN